MIYLAADHRGYELKEHLEAYLSNEGFDVEDVGDMELQEDDDYVDFAAAGAARVAEHPEKHRGIFICGSGHGVDIVANKYRGVRATMGFNIDVARQSRAHDDANVLVLSSDWLGQEAAKKIVMEWLNTPFSGEERHVRRIMKIAQVEENNFR